MQRTPLAPKSINVQPFRSPTKASPTKASPTKASPTKVSPTRKLAPKRSDSPTKSTIFNTSPTKKSRKQISNDGLSFSIFQDPTSSSSSSSLPSVSELSVNKIIPSLSNASISEDQENEGILKQRTNIIFNTNRTPLSDVNIILKPGYVHNGKLTPLTNKQQLNEPWYSSNPDVKCIPSFITPSKRRKVKYISTMNDANINLTGTNLLGKLKSFGKDDSSICNKDNDCKVHDFYLYHD